MRLIYICIIFSFFGFSQTNEVLINQAIETAESQNITTPSQAGQALKASGMTETQAKLLAKQRGLSYDQLLNDYFSNRNLENSDSNVSFESQESQESQESVENEEEVEEDKNEKEKEIAGENKSFTAKYFGYDIFNNNPYLDKEYLLGNIDEGYLIAPGDELRIITYGDNSFEQNVKVDRNGNINIRGYGLFFASGNSFKTLKSRLKVFLGKFLSGLASTPQKTFMDVSLTQLRPVKVVVLGQVTAPGPHILNTSGSALSALYAAGGVKTSGSLRNIKIYRDNKLFKTIDLYDYITKGQLREDVRLTNNDIVFVDTRKNRFLLQGEVYNNAFFELKNNEGLNELLKFSGGLPITAQTTKVNISRITPVDKRSKEIIADRELITFNYQQAKDLNKKIELLDGDKITFFPILNMELNQVTISGHVVEPGMYSLGTYKDLKTLITDAANGVLPDAYMERVDVTSISNGITINNSYNLNDIQNLNKSVLLNDMDKVQVYSNDRVEGTKLVSISGYGVSTTSIPWKENLSLYDLIFNTSQINNPEFVVDLLKSRIDIKRYNNETGEFSTLKFEFNNVKELKSTLLLPRDNVKLFSNSTTENIEKKVGMFGYVKNPGIYDLEENMYIEDLLLLSDGFLISSNQKELIVNRPEIDILNERIVRKFNVEIDKDYLLGTKDKPENGFILQDKDLVVVNKKIGYENPVRISITGEVFLEQNLVLEFKNTSFNDIINLSGGLTKYANLKSSTLTRDGKLIAIDFSKINQDDKLFLDGDEVFIASNLGLVSTTGELENENVFIWKKRFRAKYYIKNSGGKKRKTSSNSYVKLPNGKTKKIGLFKNPSVLPNSTIIVNKKEEKVNEKGKFLNDFNQTFGIIASTITTILLASKL